MSITGSMRSCCIVLAILSITTCCIGGGAAEANTVTNFYDYANAGIARADAGDYYGAIAYYDKALENSPDIAEIHYNRAVALEHLGMQKEAISEYEAAIELDPNLIQAQANLFILTADIINPITIAIGAFSVCILALIHHRNRKKEDLERRVMKGIFNK